MCIHQNSELDTSFTYPQYGGGVVLDSGALSLSKIGRIAIRLPSFRSLLIPVCRVFRRRDLAVNAHKNQLDRSIATQSPLIKIQLTEHEGEFLIALE
jgi:hypothetical protein